MKKILLFIITLLFFIPVVGAAEINKPKVTNHEKVNIYLFWASWCPHCHDFISYFSDKYEEYSDYFEIITYQLDSEYEINNQGNNELLTAVRKELGNNSNGIPFIVVGNWYKVGFGSDGSDIIKEALLAYQESEYEDVVKNVISSKGLIGFENTFEKTISIINGEDTEKEIVEDLYTIGPSNPSNNIFKIIINLIKNLFFKLFNIM